MDRNARAALFTHIHLIAKAQHKFADEGLGRIEWPDDQGPTPSQVQTVRNILSKVAESALVGYGEPIRPKEYKVLKVERLDWSKTQLMLTVEVGMVGDEGTMAEIYSRSRGRFFIGRNGGTVWYGGKKHTKREGLRCLHSSDLRGF